MVRRQIVLPGLALALLGLFSLLYATSPALYQRVLSGWCFSPYAYPFIDAEYVTANTLCWQRGVDVYVTTPCDSMGRYFDYSPLWLRLPFLALGHGWTNSVGLIQALMYCAALAVLRLPPPPGRTVLLMAVASPACLFAVERGNPDVFVFALTALALVCRRGGAVARCMAVIPILLAALLKFYPAVLLALAAREGRRMAAAVALAACAIALGFVLACGPETLRALHNLPHVGAFGDGFGAAQLGLAVQTLTGWPVAFAVRAACLCACLAGAVALARSGILRDGLTQLAPDVADCLLAGALLVTGCFLAGVSVGYRAIFLILALPGLLALGTGAARDMVGRLLGASGHVGLLLLWAQVPLALALGAPPAKGLPGPALFNALCLTRDVVWWGMVTVLLGIILTWLIQSPLIQPRAAGAGA